MTPVDAATSRVCFYTRANAARSRIYESADRRDRGWPVFSDWTPLRKRVIA